MSLVFFHALVFAQVLLDGRAVKVKQHSKQKTDNFTITGHGEIRATVNGSIMQDSNYTTTSAAFNTVETGANPSELMRVLGLLYQAMDMVDGYIPFAKGAYVFADTRPGEANLGDIGSLFVGAPEDRHKMTHTMAKAGVQTFTPIENGGGYMTEMELPGGFTPSQYNQVLANPGSLKIQEPDITLYVAVAARVTHLTGRLMTWVKLEVTKSSDHGAHLARMGNRVLIKFAGGGFRRGESDNMGGYTPVLQENDLRLMQHIEEKARALHPQFVRDFIPVEVEMGWYNENVRKGMELFVPSVVTSALVTGLFQPLVRSRSAVG